MDNETVLRIPIILASLAVGLVFGTVIGYSLFESRGKVELRKMLDSPDEKKLPLSALSETRKEERKIVNFVPVTVKVPFQENVRGARDEKEQTFIAELLDISKSGAGILATQFLKEGTTVEIFCHYEVEFSTYAKVVNMRIVERGIRMGLEFQTPLENLKI